MNIIVTGANGYIGRHLLAKLSKENNIKITTISAFDIREDKESGVRVLDITNKENVLQACVDADIIYHCAGLTGTFDSIHRFQEYIAVNEVGTLNILEAARITKEKGINCKVVFLSTRLVYKGRDIPLTEDAPKELKTVYATSKYAAEQYCQMYSSLFDIDTVVLRICLPYGSYVDGLKSYGTVEIFLQQAKQQGKITIYGDGLQRRTITHIEDIVSDIVDVSILQTQSKHSVFNIGGHDASIAEIAKYIANYYNAEIAFLPWQRQHLLLESGTTVFDSRSIKNILQRKDYKNFFIWNPEHL